MENLGTRPEPLTVCSTELIEQEFYPFLTGFPCDDAGPLFPHADASGAQDLCIWKACHKFPLEGTV